MGNPLAHGLGSAFGQRATWVDLLKALPATSDLIEDAFDAGSPDEGCGVGVPRREELGDGALKIAHTVEDAAANFGINALHSNAITFSVGVSRQWPRFTGSVTLSGGTTELVSKEGRQVVTLNPEVFIPVFRHRLPKWHARLVLGGHITDGPDGRQMGESASVNINFKSRP